MHRYILIIGFLIILTIIVSAVQMRGNTEGVQELAVETAPEQRDTTVDSVTQPSPPGLEAARQEVHTQPKQTLDPKNIPSALRKRFPSTSWEGADLSITNALSGGPGKDGIPALEDPVFVSLSESSQPDEVSAIVLEDGDSVKVYPYNILVWHEIVNDRANGVPVAVTFCPLCGSAIVFNRTLSGGETTFGVSGMLIESNMVMYDRATESLWQQSTGKALAGEHVGVTLSLVPFQLLTMGEVRTKHPRAQVLSERTGYFRDYRGNPYGGYDESDGFIFAPSSVDARYPAKEIMVVVKVGDATVAIPWQKLEEGRTYQTDVKGQAIALQRNGGELQAQGSSGGLPFYFEMWFSYAVQHPHDGHVFDPSQAE